MAAGEYVSVSSQSDIETADLKREQKELDTMPDTELKELAKLYQDRGLESVLAKQVAVQLSEHNVLEALQPSRILHNRLSGNSAMSM